MWPELGDRGEKTVAWSCAELSSFWPIGPQPGVYIPVCVSEDHLGAESRGTISYADDGLARTSVKVKGPLRGVFQNFRQEMVLAVLEL